MTLQQESYRCHRGNSGGKEEPVKSVGSLLHVLIVSNHWSLKEQYPSAGVFVDRQIASLKQMGVKISTYDVGTNYTPLCILRNWMQLRKNIRRLHPDIIHAQYGTVVGFVTALSGEPVVISFCGADLIPSATVSPMRRFVGFLLSNLASLRATGLICKTEELKSALWWRRKRAVVIPSGIDFLLFSPGSQSAARKELGWKLEQPVALFNGRDPKLKGLDIVQDAMKFVREKVPTAELHVISDVEPTRMPLYYRAADVLVCASSAEGSPNMVKEALACNLPIVSTPVGDVAQQLAGVYPSELVPREPQIMGKAVAKILRERQRSNGRDRVASLDIHKISRRLVELYCSVLESRWTQSFDRLTVV